MQRQPEGTLNHSVKQIDPNLKAKDQQDEPNLAIEETYLEKSGESGQRQGGGLEAARSQS